MRSTPSTQALIPTNIFQIVQSNRMTTPSGLHSRKDSITVETKLPNHHPFSCQKLALCNGQCSLAIIHSLTLHLQTIHSRPPHTVTITSKPKMNLSLQSHLNDQVSLLHISPTTYKTWNTSVRSRILRCSRLSFHNCTIQGFSNFRIRLGITMIRRVVGRFLCIQRHIGRDEGLSIVNNDWKVVRGCSAVSKGD